MKRQQKNRNRNGFTLVELLVVIACVAVLAAIFVHARATDKEKARRAYCQSCLKCVGLAFRTWEGDYADKYPMSVPTYQGRPMGFDAGSNMFRCFQVMSNEINNPELLICHSDIRQVASNFASLRNSNISYFVGMDTDETFPAMILSGDRNLVTNGVPVVPGLVVITNQTVGFSGTMHHFAGNIGLADGSVQQASSAGLQQYIQRSGTDANRLAIP